MRVLFATAELSPLARVGGLAEASSGLARMLRELGVDVNVVLPDYGGIDLVDEHRFGLDVPAWVGPAHARHGVAEGFGRVTLIDVDGIRRPHPYLDPATGDGWNDNNARFYRFSAAVAALAMGDPREESTFIGPVIDAAAAQRIDGWIDDAVAGGAKALARGTRKGNMLPAALLADVPHDCDLYRKEAFGPVACIEAVDDFDAALARVNDSDFGLQAGVFTADLAHAMQAWDRLEVGGVVVGDVPSFRVDNMPYGGIKQSGLGREGVRWAIADMTEERLLVIRD